MHKYYTVAMGNLSPPRESEGKQYWFLANLVVNSWMSNIHQEGFIDNKAVTMPTNILEFDLEISQQHEFLWIARY